MLEGKPFATSLSGCLFTKAMRREVASKMMGISAENCPKIGRKGEKIRL